jgi:hypothetical protein
VTTIATTVAVCLITAGSSSNLDVLNEKVDLIEINHCYDEKGQLVFDQLLFYDWCPLKSHYDVRDWCLLKSPLQIPRRNQETGGYVAMWRDGSVLRKVHAETIRESWTQYDPEIREQQYLPREQRRSFAKQAVRRPSGTAASRPGTAAATRGRTESVLRR